MSDLISVFMNRDGLTRKEAEARAEEMRRDQMIYSKANDFRILEALNAGQHLDERELKRAKEILHALKQELKTRKG